MDEIELQKYIGTKIREYRKKKNLTQDELGKRLGVKNNTISAYERGEASPSLTTSFKLASILDIKIDDLYPPLENSDEAYLDQIKEMYSKNLNAKEIHAFQQLIDKTLSMNPEDRAKYLDSIRTIVEMSR